ncbi:unnamed protein product, partial [Didymodactylos carnosus]
MLYFVIQSLPSIHSANKVLDTNAEICVWILPNLMFNWTIPSSGNIVMPSPNELEPSSFAIVQLHVPISTSKNVIFQPNKKLQEEKLIIMPNALLAVANYTTSLTIRNPTEKRFQIPLNTCMGHINVQNPKSTLNNIDLHKSTNQISKQKMTEVIDQLIQHIDNKQQQHQVRQLLEKHYKVFDT